MGDSAATTPRSGTAPAADSGESARGTVEPSRVIVNPVIGDRLTFLTNTADSGGARLLLEIELAPNGGNSVHWHRPVAGGDGPTEALHYHVLPGRPGHAGTVLGPPPAVTEMALAE